LNNRSSALTTAATLAAIAGCALAIGSMMGADYETALPPEFFISHLPVDFNTFGGGFPKGTIEDGAVYAWLTFVAINWPAKHGKRGMQDGSVPLNAPADARVWETYRARVEVYPGTGRPFDDFQRADDYGFDAPPRYIYNPARVGTYPGLPPGEVPACPGTTPSGSIPLHNLDEPDHNNVRSGLSPKEPFPGQQILLESKANRQEYVYVASRGWYGDQPIAPAKKRTGEYVRANLNTPPPAKMDDPNDTEFVSFPVHTVEIKAAWRRLGPLDDPSQFLVSRVRYYKTVNDKPCYVDSSLTDPKDRWGLVAMHITHKTPSAPYFTWATFEHVSSLVTQDLGPDGKPIPVENPEGSYSEAGNKIKAAYTPNLQIVPATLETPQRYVKDSAALSNEPQYGLYFHPKAGVGVTDVKYVRINRRINEIPKIIVDINRAAQTSLLKLAPNLPLRYYRLISTQWVPLDKKPGVVYEGPQARGVYYASNVIIEGPPANQMFSGQFVDGVTQMSDYVNRAVPALNPKPNPGAPVFLNAFFNGKGYLAGGCMGCHGSRQAYGTDWSFLLDRQRVMEPEINPE